MNAQDALIVDTYYDLINCYTTEHSCAFLRACWLLDEYATLDTKLLSRIIFSDGDSNEIYTKQERDFINQLSTEIGYYCFQILSKHGAIDCRIISVDFSDISDPLLDGIKFMKIFNKALGGFNIFLFVCPMGVHFGCSCIKSSETKRDCVITPLLSPHANWELIYDTFLSRNDSDDFLFYYSGMINAIYEIQNCFALKPDGNYPALNYYNYDDDPIDHMGKVKLADYFDYGSLEQLEPLNDTFNKLHFGAEVESCLSTLDYIQTVRINPLEMLFEAEKALEQSSHTEKHTIAVVESKNDSEQDMSDREDFEMLDDPIALLKKLKKELSI